MDYETGLYYYRARYYDPKVGRFVTKDPVGFMGGINLYSYVSNNPINKIDPLGLYETLFGPRFEGADEWPWYGGWPFNGSPLPGYSSQDNVCSYPAQYFNKNSCTKKCCQAHDDCYRRHGCNASSWLGSPFLFPGACQACNQQAVLCVARTQDPTELLSYWQIGYPVSILLSGIMGMFFPDRPWRWSIYIIFVQFVMGMFTTKGDWNLLPPGIGFYALLTVPCIGFGYIGAWVSGKWRKRNIGHDSNLG